MTPLVIMDHTVLCYLPPDRGDSHAFTPGNTPGLLTVLIYRNRKDERLSRSGWLVIPRWYTMVHHTVVYCMVLP